MTISATPPPSSDEQLFVPAEPVQLADEEIFRVAPRRERSEVSALRGRLVSLEFRQTLALVLSLIAVGAAVAVGVLFIALGGGSNGGAATDPGLGSFAPASGMPAAHDHPAGAAPHADTPAAPAAAADVKFEPYKRPDPTLPAVPAGRVKKFKLDVFEHVTKVAKDQPPTRVWSYAVNGVYHRGTGVSPPMVVEQGDKVEVTIVNGSSEKMNVSQQHSVDTHSSEVPPNEAYANVDPGKSHTFKFTADHPGVFMYHCGSQPVLMHTAAGMAGMMVVKPKGLAPVDRELWITQQEFYAGEPGKDPDMKKMEAKAPTAITFNGYANQYAEHPIEVKKGERIRMYVVNAGASVSSAFHVIGTVFDKTVVEGQKGEHAQTINLAPSQGGWVEFTLDKEGIYPFVNHAFGDMVKGSLGKLVTENAPKGSGH